MTRWKDAISTLTMDDMVSIIFLFDHHPNSDLFVMESLQKAENKAEVCGLFTQYMLEIYLARPDFLDVFNEISVIIQNFRLHRHLGTSCTKLEKVNPVKKYLYLIADKLTEDETYLLTTRFENIDNRRRYFEETLCRWQINGVVNIGLDLDSFPLGCTIEKYIQEIQPSTWSRCPNKLKNDDVEFYPIHDPNEMGYCLVINNSTFTSNKDLPHLLPKHPLQPRPGSEKDVEAVIATFSWLKFIVHHKENVTLSELKLLLSTYSKLIAEHHSCFTLVYMSHGMEGVVYTSDSIAVSLDALEMAFQRNSCPALSGKPKLFIVQACQGVELQRVMLDGVVKLPNSLQVEPQGPEKGDAVIAWSTVKGYASFRDMFDGSWFIQELCNELRVSASTKDFLDIVTIVNRNLRGKSYNGVTMVPCLTSSLCKKVKLIAHSII